MARKIKPCEFCEIEGPTGDADTVDQLSISIEVYPYNNFISFSVVGVDSEEREVELMYEVPMNYCPNCGRKLI